MPKITRKQFKYTLFQERRKRGDTIALIFASFFGSGLSPWVSGTVGTAASIPFVFWLTQNLSLPIQIAAIVGLTPFASWAAYRVDWTQRSRDHGVIVIDEFLGFWITSLFNGTHWSHWVATFFIFRFFDILKVPPVRWCDQLSKRSSPGQDATFLSGFWVIADDLLAGLQGLLLMAALFYFGWLS